MKQGNFWGSLIQQLRTEQSVSQRQLATGARVNRSTLRRIEDGTARGSIDALERLLAFLGYELEAMTQVSLADNLRRHAQAANDPALYSRAAANKLLTMSLTAA